MKKFEDLEDVARVLGDGGPFSPDTPFDTVGELVDALIERGSMPKVIAYHDEHLGLKDELSDKFLRSSLVELDVGKFESEIDAVLEQAEVIIRLSESSLSEDDIEEINEDRMSRGEDIDE